jgi:hypothetical protein
MQVTENTCSLNKKIGDAFEHLDSNFAQTRVY